MKKNLINVFALVVLLPVMNVFCQGGAQFKQVTMSSMHTRQEYLWFDFDAVDYVNGTGVTFNYPVGKYAVAPNVQITIALKDAIYDATVVFVPEITANSTSSTTVRVNVVTNGGTVAEAATDDVTVYCYALGNATS